MLIYLQVITSLALNENTVLTCVFIQLNPLYVNYYNYYNSPVYTCFLDASKAFDRISHWTMFKKLILGEVPIIIVRVLCFWYPTQELCIQSGNMRSSF